MAVSFRYTPPPANVALLVHAAVEEAVDDAAQVILDASQQLVPVDTGALKASGRVTRDGFDAVISYGQEDGAGRNGQDTAAYAIVQHERLDFHHPHGQAKFLETPLHAQADKVAEVVVERLSRALR